MRIRISRLTCRTIGTVAGPSRMPESPAASSWREDIEDAWSVHIWHPRFRMAGKTLALVATLLGFWALIA